MIKRKVEISKKKKTMFALIGTLLLLTGCGSIKDYASSDSMSYGKMSASNDTAEIMEMGEGVNTASTHTLSEDEIQNQTTERKLIKTVNMDIETKEFDTLLASIETQVAALNGYIENLNTYNGSMYSGYRQGTRNANLTIRIPKKELNVFLQSIAGMSNVVHRSEEQTDVTLTYVDIESRKAALTIEQNRLLELLERAENLEDIITIESRLSDLRYELQSMESQLRTYDNKVDYTTIYLYIDEVEVLTPVEKETIGERIGKGFINSLHSVGTGFTEFFIWIVINLPFLLIWAVVIIIILLVIKHFNRKNKKGSKIDITTQKEESNANVHKNGE